MVQQIYQLTYNKDTDEFTYSGQQPAKELAKVKRNVAMVDVGPESIQKVVSNPNWQTCEWIASGGMAGLLRVEALIRR